METSSFIFLVFIKKIYIVLFWNGNIIINIYLSPLYYCNYLLMSHSNMNFYKDYLLYFFLIEICPTF